MTPAATIATTDKPSPRKVVSRRSLQGGLIVSINLPKRNRRLTTPDGKTYIQFAMYVKGGIINVFVHGERKMIGSRVHGEATIMVKTMDDGQAYLYVDIIPTDSVRLTHELKFIQDVATLPAVLPEGTRRFNCPGEEIRGCILVQKINQE